MPPDGDLWRAMFQCAADDRPPGEVELSPYWIYAVEGGARIERSVPAIPFSREAARLSHLTRALAAYRLVFGQPRQQDLLAFLAGQLSADELAGMAEDLRIDLSPIAASAALWKGEAI